METGVQEMKHAAKVQEWSVRVAECRGSGLGVKAWCREQGISLKTYYNWERVIVKEATRRLALAAPAAPAAPTSAGMLVEVDPSTMPNGNECIIEAVVTIRHGGSEITLPAGSSAEMIAELVKELNRHV